MPCDVACHDEEMQPVALSRRCQRSESLSHQRRHRRRCLGQRTNSTEPATHAISPQATKTADHRTRQRRRGRRLQLGVSAVLFGSNTSVVGVVGLVVFGIVLGTSEAFVGIVEGDTNVDVFVNGVYMRRELSIPVLPMNGLRRISAVGTRIMPVERDDPFGGGDVVSLGVYTARENRINVSDALGFLYEYDTFAGVIAAFEDGTMTSSQWRCSTTFSDEWTLPDFNDTDWPNAIEVDRLPCCPWRDPQKQWSGFNAKWISPVGFFRNGSAPRQFFCRYRIPVSGSRLPISETSVMSPTVPIVNITRVRMGSSQVQIRFTVTDTTTAVCGVVDGRFQLRIPTPLELGNWGIAKEVEPSEVQWFTEASGVSWGYTQSATAGNWLTVSVIELCMQACIDDPEDSGECTAITFYEVGYDYATGHNCKLMVNSWDKPGFNPANKDATLSATQRMTHMYLAMAPIEHSISIQGMLLPGTIYNSYCTTRDGNLYSPWQVLITSETTERTEGCVDCGIVAPPAVFVLGGWASKNAIRAIVFSDVAGRLFCIARPPVIANPGSNASTPTPAEMFEAEHVGFNILSFGGYSTYVDVTDLPPDTEFEVFCFAERDGGTASNQTYIARTRHLWHTAPATEELTLTDMLISVTREPDGTKRIAVSTRVSIIGYIWCMLTVPATRNFTVPRTAELRRLGGRQKIEDIRIPGGGLWDGLPTNVTQEVFCTSRYDDFSNESQGDDLRNPFPTATILSGFVDLDTIRIQVLLSSGPAQLTCKAIPWRRRPNSQRPLTPTADDFDVEPYERINFQDKEGAIVGISFSFLATGAWHDVYCYSEEVVEVPPGSIPPIRRGMSQDGISNTRTSFRTKGPEFEDGGWHCVSGRTCSVSNVRGDDLQSADQVLARVDRCPGRCLCNGEEDEWNKGAVCSSVEQGPSIVQPPPGFETNPDQIDRMDPRGPWCYVDRGACDDEVQSEYTSHFVSWTACSYTERADRPGSGPPGFANNGIGVTRNDVPNNFYWSTDSPFIAFGRAYQICWCNATSSPCTLEVHFRLAIGLLHVAGPSAEQQATTSECVAGRPCIISNFEGHALEQNSRLAVLPLSESRCAWQRTSPFSYPGVPLFPQVGVSDPSTSAGRNFSWGILPVLSVGGIYQLCWCGAVAADAPSHRRRTNGVDKLPKARPFSCPPSRPDDGSGFLSPAGTLAVIGPLRVQAACSIGLECKLSDVPGNGLRGGDRMAVLDSCGYGSSPPAGWFQGADGEVPPEGWQLGGWLTWGKQLSESMLIDLGAPVTALMNQRSRGDTIDRGVWGVPNLGISAGPTEGAPTTIGGQYRWGAPTWALAGEYALCWCAASRGVPCFAPEHFVVPAGTLSITGPATLPAASQVHICLRGRRCEVIHLKGTVPQGGELFISVDICGTLLAPIGAPRDGFSFPSEDGEHFRWGDDPLTSSPGRYRICYCPTTGKCAGASDYGAFAGILSVKGPLSLQKYWFCSVGRICNVTGIWGEALHDGDTVQVMTVCGSASSVRGFENEGRSTASYNLGTARKPMLKFTLPPTSNPGRFRLCYCPAEAMCVRTQDYFVDLGLVEVGGPDAGLIYLCYEWRPCTIRIDGTSLRNGDRMVVAPPGTECTNVSSEATGQLPLGVGKWARRGISFHATDNGQEYTWGPSNVLAKPGVYTLCWCSSGLRRRERQLATTHTSSNGDNNNNNNDSNGSLNATDAQAEFGCDADGPFDVLAGNIRLAPYREFQFLTREPEPEPRDNDAYLAYLLAAPLPFLFCIAICLGWRKLSGRTQNEPEAPPLFKAKKPWAAAEQEKTQHMHAVRTVMETRIRVLEQVRNLELGGQECEQPVPSFLKPEEDNVPIWVKKKRLKEKAEELAAQKANSQEALEGDPSDEQLALQGSESQLALPEPPGVVALPEEPAPPPFNLADWKQTETSNGQTYYYNQRTGETRWTMPQPNEAKFVEGSTAARKKFAKFKPLRVKKIPRTPQHPRANELLYGDRPLNQLPEVRDWDSDDNDVHISRAITDAEIRREHREAEAASVSNRSNPSQGSVIDKLDL
eukprot:TRINITY_DN2455_c0_g1_i1.p1 TRINITY_DN2455_c0_g1~~TRINITY_DN2455_c0_g1_i1.p1  ORF type:complete len:2063 (+),score=218.42 TRINITY_DN2455_c0_g1_i1:52-6189(+)